MHTGEHLLVLDKPSGWPSQRTRAGRAGVVEWAQERHPSARLHHRLDQPASGLMALSLSAVGRRWLSSALADHSARRTYLAVCQGLPAASIWSTRVDGQHARTHVEVLGHGGGFAALCLRLETGRKHQIRLHAATDGHPLVGDRRYGAEVGRAWPRLALHAWRLELPAFEGHGPLTCQAPLPGDLAALWSITGAPAP